VSGKQCAVYRKLLGWLDMCTCWWGHGEADTWVHYKECE